jgi:hypothetical protein
MQSLCRILQFAALLLASILPSLALDPRINEFVADNQHGLADADGDEVDWVELYNPNPVALDLTGWYLTDDLAATTKWQFPSTSINAHGYLVVFASGKDRRIAGSELHTNFNLKATGEALALVKPDGVTVVSQFEFGPQQTDVSFGPAAVTSSTETLIAADAPAKAFVPANNTLGTTWTMPAFTETGWTSGTLAAGYETGTGYQALLGLDVRTAMSGLRTTCYLRIPFPAANVTDALALTLRMRYDDGFAVYLNGTLLPTASRNAPATLAYNSAAIGEHDDNEATVYEDIDISQHLGLLVPGAPNVLAVHGLNYSASSSDFLIGPQLLLTHGTLTNGFMPTPTPGAANTSGVQGFVAAPAFSVERGFCAAPFDLALSTATPGATIRYTRNGDTPTATTGFVYTAPLTLTGTTILRAAAFKDGFQASRVETHTYLFLDDILVQSTTGAAPAGWPSGTFNGQKFDYGMDPNVVNGRQATIKSALQAIPTISFVTDLPNLVDASTGIYVNTYDHGAEWERPVSMEILNDPLNPGAHGFQENAGVRVRGGFSRAPDNPKHSLRLFFRGDYGAGKLNYRLFGNRGPAAFDGFDLRTSQDASWAYVGSGENTFLRDETARETQVALSYGSRCRYFHVYLNGQYWGLYDTDERPNNNYGEQYFGGKKENYDVLKSSGASGGYRTEASDGTMATGSAWELLWNGARTVRASPTNANYFKLLGRAADGTTPTTDPVVLDAVNLADYMATLFYMGGNDGPVSEYVGASNNWFGMRRRGGDFGFRFFIHDFEQSLGLEATTNQRVGSGANVAPWSNTVAGKDDITRSNPEFLHEDLARNLEYRVLFGDRVHRHLFNGGAMTDASVLARMAGLAATIDTAIWGESARWGDAQREPPFVRQDWLDANARLFSFISSGTTAGSGPGRAATLIAQLRGYDSGTKPLYPLTNAPVFSQHGGAMPAAGTSITMTHANAGMAAIYYTVNGADPRLVGGGLNPSAQLYSGLVPVSGWTATVRARVQNGSTWSALNEAVFVRSTTPPPIRITELLAAPAGPSASEKAAGHTDKDDFEFLELTNSGTETVNLRQMRFSEGLDFTFLEDVYLAAGARAVLVRNRAAFLFRYGAGPRIVGEYVGALDDTGEHLTLLSALGTPIVDFTYDHAAPWTETLTGQSLVLRGPSLDPTKSQNWRASVAIGGSPASVDSTNYDQWKTAHGVASETADLDHDGLLPLVEYATGGSPTISDPARNPRVSIATLPGPPAADYLLLTVRRQRGTDDLAVSFEKSDDLVTWTSATVEPYANTPQPDGTDLEVWKVLPAVNANSTAFLRVRWTRAP